MNEDQFKPGDLTLDAVAWFAVGLLIMTALCVAVDTLGL